MIKKLKATLAVVALLGFPIGCGVGGDSPTVKRDGVTPISKPAEPDSLTPVPKPVEPDSATPTPKGVWVVPWPVSWPAAPLPVMWLEHQSGPARGSPQRYCWQFEDAADPVYEEYTIWSGVREYPETPLGAHIPITIDAETRPSKMFAQMFTRPGAIMAGGLRRLSTTSPGLDLAGLGPVPVSTTFV